MNHGSWPSGGVTNEKLASDSSCGSASNKEWEKLEKTSAWNLTKVRSKKEVIDEARTKGAKVHFASLMDICHLKNAELEAKHQKYKGRVVLRGDIVKGRFWLLCCIYRAEIVSITNDSSKSHGYHFQIARFAMDKQQMQHQLIPKSKWRMLEHFETSLIGISRYLDTSTTTQMT